MPCAGRRNLKEKSGDLAVAGAPLSDISHRKKFILGC
jgi:hypothetical protein